MANARNYLATGNFSVRLIIHALLNIEAFVPHLWATTLYSSVCQTC
jgi:hypothetical protein